MANENDQWYGHEGELSLEEKRQKIMSNYETIDIMKQRVEQMKQKKTNGMNRATYIKMIFDATNKVQKQSDELTKAISDVRRLQSDINSLNGRLDRNFMLVESIILRESKDDSWTRECRHLLNIIHAKCDHLIQSVQEAGELTRELRQ